MTALALAAAALTPTGSRAEDAGYIFTSFRDSGDGLHLAYSQDGRDWTEIPGNRLKPEVGSKLMRDPHILRGPDGMYRMVWTSGWHDKGIGYASSDDLVEWSKQEFLPLMEKVSGTETCWAPEIYYDEAAKDYLIVWSSAVKGPGDSQPRHRAYFSRTKDFQTFTPSRIFFDPGFDNIDTTIVPFGKQFALFCKETDDQPKGKWGAIRAAVSDKLSGPYKLLPEAPLANQRAEGPAPVVLGDKILLYFDYYSNGKYGAVESKDLKTWTDATPNIAIAPGQRHGTILEVPGDVLARLREGEKELLDAVPAAILGGFTADPAIRAFGDTYYIYPTSDRPNWNTTEFAVWSSKNLIDWKKERVALDITKDLKWGQNKAWAPDCIERNGTYYFYFCAEGKVGVATSKSPAGPFVDALGKPLLDRKADSRITSNTIDPYPFIDEDGQAYLYWGNSGDRANVFKLKPDMVTLDGPPHEIVIKGKSGGDVVDFREGIVVFKRDGKYYFMWSVDDARSDNYRVAYGIAKSPLGPVEIPAEGAIVLRKNGLAKGTGHHSVVNVPRTDRWYAAYHRHAVPGGGGYKREVCLVRMEFNPDGSIKPMDPLVEPFKPGDKGEPITK